LARSFIIPAEHKPGGLRLVFDIETNGLDTATTVHCIVIADLDGEEIFEHGPTEIATALEHLARTDCLVGHNIAGYDLPLLHRLYDWQPLPICTILDTLIASRLILPHVADLDDQAAAMGDAALGKLRGRYKLEAWGVRLGIPKVGTDIEDWSAWTPQMQARCVGDVELCKALFHFLQPDGYSTEALALEHRVSGICDRITADGVPFDVTAAEQLRRQWTTRRAELAAQLSQQFPGTNLNSRLQIARLLEARGWVPEKRTEKTRQPCINDEVLETIPAVFPEFTGLAEYDLLRRRIAQLDSGKEAWLRHIGDDGRIHGALIHIGTPHSRAKHLTPNIAQVPNPKKGATHAAECRALFRHPGDWVFVTCDQANLQDRAFAHHITAFDGGVYGQAFLAGLDQHWQNAIALGLVPAGTERVKDSKLHTALREGAKTFRYGYLFGAGVGRCGEILRETVRAGKQIEPTYTASTDGRRARDRFIAATPGLQRLRSKLEALVARQQWLPGLDGRCIPCRAQYTALNYALTSIEAIVCKRWLVNVYDELCARFRYGWDGDVVIPLWVHDEIACCCRPEIADVVGEILVRHAKEAGEHFKLQVPLAAEYKIGRSWAGEPLENAPGTNNHHDDVEADFDTKSRQSTVISPWEEEHPALALAEPEEPEPWPKPRFTWDDINRAFNEQPRDSAHSNGKGNDHDHDRDGAQNSRFDGYPHGESRAGQTIATFVYRDHLGRNHTKIEKKTARDGGRNQYPQSFWVDGKWVYKRPKGWLKIPYRLPELLAALTAAPDVAVFIPEGEKDANSLVALDLIATTSSEGATPPKAKISNWTPELNRWFHGIRRVYILEDNDEPGRKFAREKVQALAGIVPDIRIVSFLDVPDGEDVTWWLQHGHGKDELMARCDDAPRVQDAATLDHICAADVAMRAIEWMWPNRFAIGKIGIIAGLPDVGKGQILCYICARITASKGWPNCEGNCPQGSVLILSAEEDPATNLTPRLAASGADLHKVYFIKMVSDRDEKSGQPRKRMFSLIGDLEKLRRKILQLGDVKAVLIDPVSAYLGVGLVDSYRDTDVRAVLGPLKELAEELKVAVITVMHFNKKQDITNALLRVSNSMAFVGLPRHAYGVIADPEHQRKLFVRAKNNDAADSDNQTLAFHCSVKDVGTDPETGAPIRAPYIVWEPGYVDVTATEALSAANENKAPAQRDEAKKFLRAMLAAGPMPMTDIKEAADGNGLSWATVRRAKDDLRVEARKDVKPDGKWLWELV
jgi:DNA polymerase I-like protein with 3'-5' exonuclease and polymerase domains